MIGSPDLSRLKWRLVAEIDLASGFTGSLSLGLSPKHVYKGVRPG
jgi:hypothetical protein